MAMPASGHAVEGPPDPVLVLLVAVPPPAPPSPVEVDDVAPPEPLPVSLPQPASIEAVEAKETTINERRALRMIGEDTPDPRKSGANLGHFDPA
jgi:hypothetical protein